MTQGAFLPPPPDIGLPAKFDSWWPGQVDAIATALDAPTRFCALVLPTGFGKSLTYMGILQMLLPLRGLTLTATKALQGQLAGDFVDLDPAIVQGQKSYLCKALMPGGELAAQFASSNIAIRRSPATVEMGPCHSKVQCSLRAGGCGYFDALRKAEHPTTAFTLANYAFWLTLGQRPQLAAIRPDVLILDEAHDAPDALSDAIGATIAAELCAQVLQEKLPGPAARSPLEWHTWAKDRAKRLTQWVEAARPGTREALAGVRRAQTLLYALKRIGSIDPDLLVISDEHDGVRFDLIWAAPLAESWLFRGVRKVILTSATMTRHTADLLGIMAKDLTFYEAGTGFPADRRPVYIAPARKMPWGEALRIDHRMTRDDEQSWLTHLDHIIGERPDRKGIVHCVSYARRDQILAGSAHRGRLMTHGRHDTQTQIAAFKLAPPGTVLVSPAVTTGYDFPFAECEYQIVAKIPFPDSRDPITKARTIVDAQYPAHIAMQGLVQMVGRGMRAPTDRCETFIADAHAQWFLRVHKTLAPRWFLRAVKSLEAGAVPVPPPPLSVTSRG